MKLTITRSLCSDTYSTPMLSVVEFNTEAGFCQSRDASTDDFMTDDSWNDMLQ